MQKNQLPASAMKFSDSTRKFHNLTNKAATQADKQKFNFSCEKKLSIAYNCKGTRFGRDSTPTLGKEPGNGKERIEERPCTEKVEEANRTSHRFN